MQLKEPVISNYKTYVLSPSPIPLDVKEYFLNEDANYNWLMIALTNYMVYIL